MDKGALQYYEGLARGRNPKEGGAWGLIDAQLKAIGHPGLNPDTKPIGVQFSTATDAQGKVLPDVYGLEILRRRVSNAMKYPNTLNNHYITNTALDMQNNNGTSVWDRPENLQPYLQGAN